MAAARLPMPTIPFWPAPRDPRTVDELLVAAERRDPFGHGVHLILAGLFCAFGGVATSTLEISSALLLIFAAMRLPFIWRVYSPTLVTAISVTILAYLAWSAMSIAWSPRPNVGVEEFLVARMLLPTLALWPLMRQRRALAWCLIAGMCLQSFALILSMVGLLPHGADGLRRYVGLGSHPGHVTLWFSMAAMAALALLRGASARERSVLVAAFACIVFGAFTAGGRGSLLGLCAGGLLVLATTLVSGRISKREWLIGGGILLAILGTTVLLRGSDLVRAANRIERQLTRTEASGDPRNSTAYRLYWWKLAYTEWTTAPLTGTGIGSWRAWARGQPETLRLADELDTTTDDLILDHPHSVYLQILAETGAIGAGLALAAAIAIARGTLRAAQHDPVTLAGIACLTVWAVSSVFEGNHVSPRGMAALSVALAFATLPPLLAIRPPPKERR